jgi:hypothetical protein
MKGGGVVQVVYRWLLLQILYYIYTMQEKPSGGFHAHIPHNPQPLLKTKFNQNC